VRKFTTLCFTFITLTGCSQGQDTGQDLVACKKKAVELVRSSGLDPETTITPTLHYLDECMKSKGYSPTLMCSSSAAREGLPLCWESSSKQ
jgi:hypothetical protein